MWLVLKHLLVHAQWVQSHLLFHQQLVKSNHQNRWNRKHRQSKLEIVQVSQRILCETSSRPIGIWTINYSRFHRNANGLLESRTRSNSQSVRSFKTLHWISVRQQCWNFRISRSSQELIKGKDHRNQMDFWRNCLHQRNLDEIWWNLWQYKIIHHWKSNNEKFWKKNREISNSSHKIIHCSLHLDEQALILFKIPNR